MKLSMRILAYLAASAIILGVALSLLATFDGLLGGNADTAITAASRAALAQHPALMRLRAQLARLERQHLVDGARLAAAGDSLAQLAAAADSADSVRAVAAGQPIPLPSPWKAVADSNRLAYGACRQGVLACEARAQSAELEADSLARRLAAQLTVKPQRCWLSAGWGYAVGAGTRAFLGASCGLVRIPLLP